MVQLVRERVPATLMLAALILAGQAQLGMAGTPTNTAQPPAGLAPAAIETLTYDLSFLRSPPSISRYHLKAASGSGARRWTWWKPSVSRDRFWRPVTTPSSKDDGLSEHAS